MLDILRFWPQTCHGVCDLLNQGACLFRGHLIVILFLLQKPSVLWGVLNKRLLVSSSLLARSEGFNPSKECAREYKQYALSFCRV